ncbi:hypothetical protein PIB30_065326 [Stylosanthes scabra]|uniref:Uncharacterized protein n=1 Tax=Stylosanthes scabra TaxID=79078 RepID=A0ABU6QLW1_9FABA|nr:hypothetical protein [Stylosanthes scabra]
MTDLDMADDDTADASAAAAEPPAKSDEDGPATVLLHLASTDGGRRPGSGVGAATPVKLEAAATSNRKKEQLPSSPRWGRVLTGSGKMIWVRTCSDHKSRFRSVSKQIGDYISVAHSA